MADEIVVKVEPGESEPEEIAAEVAEESEEKWERELETVREVLTLQGQALTAVKTSLELLTARLPENLNQLIQSQQEMIQSQNRELMETVRTILTPPPPPPQAQPEPEKEAVLEEVEIPAPPQEKQFHKRRRI